MRVEAIQAMAALFQFSEAMDAGLSIEDLREVMTKSIESGLEILSIQLAMAQIALEEPDDDRR